MIRILEDISSQALGWWIGTGPELGTYYKIDGYSQDVKEESTHWYWAANNRDKLLPGEHSEDLTYKELWPKVQAKWVRALYDPKDREMDLQVETLDRIYYNAVIDFILHLSEKYRIDTIFVDDFEGNDVWKGISFEEALNSKSFQKY